MFVYKLCIYDTQDTCTTRIRRDPPCLKLPIKRYVMPRSSRPRSLYYLILNG